MLLNQLNTSNHARLAQIIHTLRSVHGFDLPTDQSHKWHSLQEHYQGVQSAIVESSTFNSYHTNPEYTKAALITEAVRILFEIAPRRRRKPVQENQETSMRLFHEGKTKQIGRQRLLHLHRRRIQRLRHAAKRRQIGVYRKRCQRSQARKYY